MSEGEINVRRGNKYQKVGPSGVQITKTKVEKNPVLVFVRYETGKKDRIRREFCLFPVSYLTKTETGFFSTFFDFRFCNLYHH